MLVLQGNAAIKLRCGGKIFILVISYFLLILAVKEFFKSTNICQSYSKNKSGSFFDSQCTLLRHVRIAESEPYCHSILFVCLSIIPRPTAYHDWSITTKFGRQVYTIYLSSDQCKPFWTPCLPYFGCQREKYAKFRLFPTRILATANVTHRAIWLVLLFYFVRVLTFYSEAGAVHQLPWSTKFVNPSNLI